MHRSLRALSLAVMLSSPMLAAGCAADTSDDEIPAIDESTEDVVSASKLVGEYGEGRGRFASMALRQLTEGGRRTNRFEAQQIVQCVQAPCPTVAVSGKWFARSGSLTLYPEGQPRETYKVTLDGRKLSFTDARGVRVAELERRIPAPGGVTEALARHGVPRMKAEIEEVEVAAQEGAQGVEVKFPEAFDQALELFLSDTEGGLPSTVAEFEDDLREECGQGADLVRCLANSPSTSVRLQKRSDDTAPYGEGAEASWVIVFSLSHFTDHGYFAVVPKKHGGEAPYVYAFN